MEQKKYKIIKILIICSILLFIVYIFNYIKENRKIFTIKPTPEFSNVIKEIKKEYSYVKSIRIEGNFPYSVAIKIYVNEDKKKEDAELKEINYKILEYAKSDDFVNHLKNQKRLFYTPYKKFSLNIGFNYKKNISSSRISNYYYEQSDDEEIWRPEN